MTSAATSGTSSHPRFPGHSVLQVPVPALEPWVRGRTAFHDPAYVSSDPLFVHAHVTALGPFLPAPSPDDLAEVARIAATTEPFAFTLARTGTFPNGIVHLLPEPAAPFAALTRSLAAAFPGCPPYGGEFVDPVPHLTLDALSPDVTEESTRAALGDLLPATALAERLDLVWYEQDGCRVLHTWRLGGTGQNS